MGGGRPPRGFSYRCSFQCLENGVPLAFPTIIAWSNHESRTHNRIWRCNFSSCDKTYLNYSEYRAHVVNGNHYHPGDSVDLLVYSNTGSEPPRTLHAGGVKRAVYSLDGNRTQPSTTHPNASNLDSQKPGPQPSDERRSYVRDSTETSAPAPSLNSFDKQTRAHDPSPRAATDRLTHDIIDPVLLQATLNGRPEQLSEPSPNPPEVRKRALTLEDDQTQPGRSTSPSKRLRTDAPLMNSASSERPPSSLPPQSTTTERPRVVIKDGDFDNPWAAEQSPPPNASLDSETPFSQVSPRAAQNVSSWSGRSATDATTSAARPPGLGNAPKPRPSKNDRMLLELEIEEIKLRRDTLTIEVRKLDLQIMKMRCQMGEFT